MPNLALPAQIWDFRCSAHQYRMLVAGHCHFLMYNRLLPWDHLPGWLLHREAGGFARRFDGSEYRPGEIDGGLICAPDEESWHALRAAPMVRDGRRAAAASHGAFRVRPVALDYCLAESARSSRARARTLFSMSAAVAGLTLASVQPPPSRV